MRLMRVGLAAIRRSANWSCATARIARPTKVRDMKSCSPPTSASATRQGTSRRNGRSTTPRLQAGPDIGCLDQAVVDAEHQHQRDLGDEQQAEEECEAAQCFIAASFEGDVVDLVDRGAEQIERRQREHGGQDRIHPQRRVGQVGDVGTEDDEGGMGNVDDVEHAEGDRHADRDGGIESAKQQPGHHGIAEEGDGRFHYGCQSGQCAGAWLVPRLSAPAKRKCELFRWPVRRRAIPLHGD